MVLLHRVTQQEEAGGSLSMFTMTHRQVGGEPDPHCSGLRGQ